MPAAAQDFAFATKNPALQAQLAAWANPQVSPELKAIQVHNQAVVQARSALNIPATYATAFTRLYFRDLIAQNKAEAL